VIAIKKIFDFKKSIISRIVILFIVMFVFLLTPIILQTYISFEQSSSYTEMTDNIVRANQLSTDVSTKIEPVVWGIVAGKVGFEDSDIMPLIENIKSQMDDIRSKTSSVESRGIIEIAMRATDTLEDYLNILNDQIISKAPVEDNEKILEEIRLCVDGIKDLLQEFSSKQIIEVEAFNQEASKQSNRSFIINILLTLIVICVGIFAFWYLSRVIMNPIEKLLRMSNRISEGDFSSRVEIAASEEFNELASSMNTMSEKIELLIEKSIEEEKHLQMLEYRAHQAQISPHFLYNTLDAIIWAAEANENAKVITLVTSLSSFFRISLSHGTDFISISDEIEHVKNYLEIQQIRYSDVLSYEINVDEGLGGQEVLKLLLQPLVENSLYHGIKGTREKGKITVSVLKRDNKVRFSVADNGIGMTEETLAALKTRINNESGDEKGYGLFNINRRLKLYYKLNEGIEIKSEYKKGTEVSYTLDIL